MTRSNLYNDKRKVQRYKDCFNYQNIKVKCEDKIDPSSPIGYHICSVDSTKVVFEEVRLTQKCKRNDLLRQISRPYVQGLRIQMSMNGILISIA